MSRLRWLPVGWAAFLALLMLWPVLGVGYVLSYDMVWVPDLVLRSDFLGLGSGLPRAVPSDAVVAIADELLPGMLLQKLVLLGALIGAGAGAAKLGPSGSLPGRLVAVSFYEWNPFVVERLHMGHWPVLVCYGALPWIVLAARRLREEGRVPVRLLWLMPVASLSASAGLVAAVALVAFAARRGSRRTGLAVLGLVLLSNAPWWVSGLLHAGAATSDRVGAEVFALSDEGTMPGPVAALGLGGIWNAEVVPSSREGMLAWVALAGVAALAALGARAWARAVGRRDGIAFVVCWVVGFGVAVLTWALPEQVGWLVAQVPGAGLLRDGARMLALCAPLLCALVAYGAARVAEWIVQPVPRASLAVGLALFPLAVLPEAAFGLAGALRLADYPAAYAEAREVVEAEHPSGQDVLILPFTSYRAPDWNHGLKVLDPLGRYLTPDFVASDELRVSGRAIAGEDPRGEQVREALAAPSPDERARALADLGIGTVVVDVPQAPVPEVAGTPVLDSGEVTVVRLDDPVRDLEAPTRWVVLMGLAWLCYLGIPALAAILTVRQVMLRRSPGLQGR